MPPLLFNPWKVIDLIDMLTYHEERDRLAVLLFSLKKKKCHEIDVTVQALFRFSGGSVLVRPEESVVAR